MSWMITREWKQTISESELSTSIPVTSEQSGHLNIKWTLKKKTIIACSSLIINAWNIEQFPYLNPFLSELLAIGKWELYPMNFHLIIFCIGGDYNTRFLVFWFRDAPIAFEWQPSFVRFDHRYGRSWLGLGLLESYRWRTLVRWGRGLLGWWLAVWGWLGVCW